jgi:2-polyprenyl-3-methyl-5-hydroxy-6-metoxy-1,4-benzoquinol methylase
MRFSVAITVRPGASKGGHTDTPVVVKPTSYPDQLNERCEQEWRAYDDYYSENSLKHPYFYHHRKREGAFLDALSAQFGIQRGASIIDIGCGNRFYCGLFADRGMRVTGVDRSAKAIKYCEDTLGSQMRVVV